jgi:hypothetical protein
MKTLVRRWRPSMKILGRVLGAHILKIYNGLGHNEGKFEKFYIRTGKTRGHWINTGLPPSISFPWRLHFPTTPFLITRFP